MQGDSEGDAALWAIDLKWFEERSHNLLRHHHKDCPDGSNFGEFCQYINQILFSDHNPYLVIPASAMLSPKRMLAQQGYLLCRLRHDVNFSSSLLGMLIRPSIVDRQVVSRVVLRREQRISFLEELRRMNVHSASLFPGLDGFARSLAEDLEISVAHQIEALKKEMIENIQEDRLRHPRPQRSR
jgi:hypothetical protein